MSQYNVGTARKKRILVLVETSRGYGRGVIEGISRFSQECNEWSIYFEDAGLDGFRTIRQSAITRRNWDGVISRSTTRLLSTKLKATGIPMVELLAPIKPKGVFPDVITDYETVSRWAVEHFLERKLRNFAYFSMVNTKWSNFRGDLFERNLAEHSLDCHHFPVCENDTHFYPHILESWNQNFRNKLGKWLLALPKPVGLFVATDSYAIYILQMCQNLKISVPDEIAVLACDNDLLVCRSVFPPLSSIDHNCQEVGYRASHLLHDRMAKKNDSGETIFVQPSFIATRQSTDTIAVEDELFTSAITFIKNNLGNNIGVMHVVRAVGVARKTLERRFRSILGRTPAEEIANRRLQHAKYLLCDTTLPLEKIAEQCGFLVLDYFSRVFKRECGLTPNQYRKAQLRYIQ